MLRFFIFPLAALTTAALNAQDAPLFLTRSLAVQRALADNYQIRAARLQIERAQARTLDAGAMPNPSLNAGGASDFAFNNEGQYAWSVGLAQDFPVTGRLRLLRTIAQREVTLAEWEIREAELTLASRVGSAFDNLEALEAELKLMDAQCSLNQHFEDFLQERVERAEASSLDVRQVRLTLAALEQQRIRLERRRKEQLAELRILLGLDSTREIDIAERTRTWPTQLPSFAREKLPENPSFALKQQLLTIAEDRTNLALAERWADITVEVFFEEAYTIDQPVGFDNERMLGIGVSIPLPIHSRNHGAIESSRVQKRQLEQELQAMAFELLSRAESLRGRYETIQQQIAEYHSSVIEVAARNEADLENAYATGQVGLTDVFRAQERLLELRTSLIDLKAERASLYTQWLYVTAQTLSPLSHEIQ